jgi:Na+/H+-dicarboxylate symporter
MKFRSLSLNLLFICSFVLVLGNHVPIPVKELFYTISLITQKLVLIASPFIIFLLIINALNYLEKRSAYFVILLFITILLSNFFSILTGYTVGIAFAPEIDATKIIALHKSDINTLLNLKLLDYLIIPYLIPISILAAVSYSIIPKKNFLFNDSLTLYNFFYELNKLTPYILPALCLGLLFKIQHDGAIAYLSHNLTNIFYLVITTQAIYCLFLYIIAAKLHPRKLLIYLRNIFPAFITGFVSMSSAATMAITILCTHKNITNKKFATLVVTTSSNFHTIGSSIGVTIVVISLIKTFNLPYPSFYEFLAFAAFYTIAKFIVVGIPSGGSYIIGPILISALGFPHDMVSITILMYIMLDSFGTSINVACNGAYAIIFNNIMNKTNIKANRNIALIKSIK